MRTTFRMPPPVAVFECHCADTRLKESVYLVGSSEELGSWQIDRGTALITSAKEFPLWRSCVFTFDSVKPGDEVEFKFFIGPQTVNWERVNWETCEPF